ncbi:MAG TPA: hypothetical protein ENH82_08785 [bacterium]|nr:hypothetical protein [bacterium]
MKTREIIQITLCILASLLMVEFFVNYLVPYGTFQRFMLRAGFQIQLFLLIYLFFDSRDNSRRLNVLERRFAKSLRLRSKERRARMKNEKTEKKVMED